MAASIARIQAPGTALALPAWSRPLLLPKMSDSALEDRLEAKRRRLRELRERNLRRQQSAAVGAAEPAGRTATQPSAPGAPAAGTGGASDPAGAAPATPPRARTSAHAAAPWVVDDVLSKPPPGTPEKGDSWVPEATRRFIADKAVRQRRDAVVAGCAVATALGLCAIAPARQAVTYEKGSQTDAGAGPDGTAADGASSSASTARQGQAVGTGDSSRRSSTSGSTGEGLRSRRDAEAEGGDAAAADAAARLTAAAEAACAGAGASADTDASAGAGVASVFGSSVAIASLRRVSGAIQRLLSSGSAEWNLLLGLDGGRDATAATDEEDGLAAVLSRVGRMGAGAVSRSDGGRGATRIRDHGDVGRDGRPEGSVRDGPARGSGATGGAGWLGADEDAGDESVTLVHGLGRAAVTDMAWGGRQGQHIAAAYAVTGRSRGGGGGGSGRGAAAASARDCVESIAAVAEAAGGGAVAVWSVAASGAPLSLLSADAPVTAVEWHPFAPALVLGGLDSGRIVAWDTRTGDRSPVSMSSLSRDVHCHPVFGVVVTGTAGAHSLATVSSDGRLCSWPEPTRLAEPSFSTALEWDEAAGRAAHMGSLALPLGVTCATSPAGAGSVLTLGAADGNIYETTLSGRHAEVRSRIGAHSAPVSSVQHHPGGAGGVFSETILTSSLDWTVRVWSRRAAVPEVARLDGFNDYVLDAAWCPAACNPSLIAAGDNEGRLTLWSVGQSTTEPLGETKLLPGGGVTKVRWAADGNAVVAGDSAGGIHVLAVSQQGLDVRGVSADPLREALAFGAFGRADKDQGEGASEPAM